MLAGVAAFVVLVPLVVVRSSHHPDPLFNPQLFRIRSVWSASATTVLTAGVGMGIWLSWPLLLTQGLGYSTLQTGLMLTPVPIVMALTAFIGGRTVDRFGTGQLSLQELLRVDCGAGAARADDGAVTRLRRPLAGFPRVRRGLSTNPGSAPRAHAPTMCVHPAWSCWRFTHISDDVLPTLRCGRRLGRRHHDHDARREPSQAARSTRLIACLTLPVVDRRDVGGAMSSVSGRHVWRIGKRSM